MTDRLQGKRVAILLTNGFEQVEMTDPRQALEGAGATVRLVSLQKGRVKGWNHDQPADDFEVDVAVADADAAQFDALLLPGGVANPDTLRADARAVAFVRAFADAGKPIAAICHGPWTLIDAEAVRGRRMTSWPSLRADLRNAGATWVDEQVVVDGNLVTSRKPDDLPAFNREFAQLVAAAGGGAKG